MRMTLLRATAMLVAFPVLFIAPEAAAKARLHPQPRKIAANTGLAKMTSASLQSCDAKSATINLVDEGLLTWTAITPESIDRYAKPVTLGPGDPRLAKLNALLQTLTLQGAVLPQLEMRMMLRLACADGTARVITGSKTDSDGHMHLSIDGKMAMTVMPFRHALEAIVNAKAR